MSPDDSHPFTLPPPENLRTSGPQLRPNGRSCIALGCDEPPRGNCDLCPPHQRFSNAFERWLRREFDRERASL